MPKPLDGPGPPGFPQLVILSPDEFEAWLATAESRRVGQRRKRAIVSRSSGRRSWRSSIPEAEDEAASNMSKVVGFIRRPAPRSPRTWSFALALFAMN